MDFYDETTAIFWTLYYFAILVIPDYDRKKAIHSVSKKLFYFEGTKYINNAKMKKLKDILNSNEVKESKIIGIKTKDDENDDNIIYTKNAIKIENISKESSKQSLKSKNKENEKDDVLIDYSNYNLFEIIGSFKIFCKTEKFKKKLYLYEQAENIIDEKLDVIYYIRNMILFELINKIYLENDEIINFLSRPILYYSSSDKKSEFNSQRNDTVSFISKLSDSNNQKIKYKKLYIPKCFCLISLYPFINEMMKIGKNIYKYSTIKCIGTIANSDKQQPTIIPPKDATSSTIVLKINLIIHIFLFLLFYFLDFFISTIFIF